MKATAQSTTLTTTPRFRITRGGSARKVLRDLPLNYCLEMAVLEAESLAATGRYGDLVVQACQGGLWLDQRLVTG